MCARVSVTVHKVPNRWTENGAKNRHIIIEYINVYDACKCHQPAFSQQPVHRHSAHRLHMYMPIYQISNNYYNRSRNKIYCIFHCSLCYTFSSFYVSKSVDTRHICWLTMHTQSHSSPHTLISTSGFNFIIFYICMYCVRCVRCEAMYNISKFCHGKRDNEIFTNSLFIERIL